jgi:cell division protein FtsZ
LRQGVQGISDIITIPGLINVDFADVKAIMSNAGSALMGIGRASGDKRASVAAKEAINSPLLEISIDGARGILFNISGNKSMTMAEINEAANIISTAADPDANIIFGATIREDLGEDIKISVIATGFDENRKRLQTYMGRNAFVPRPNFSKSEESSDIPNFVQDEPAPKELAPLTASDSFKSKMNIKHREVEIEDDLDIPAFLRQRN